LCLISKATWISQKKIDIDRSRFNSDAKVLALLNRCGQYLEEIATQTHLPQYFGAELLLGQICPNLKSISFLGSSTFCLTNVPEMVGPEAIQAETDRLILSLSKLERFERHSGTCCSQYEDNIYVSTSRM